MDGQCDDHQIVSGQRCTKPAGHPGWHWNDKPGQNCVQVWGFRWRHIDQEEKAS